MSKYNRPSKPRKAVVLKTTGASLKQQAKEVAEEVKMRQAAKVNVAAVNPKTMTAKVKPGKNEVQYKGVKLAEVTVDPKTKITPEGRATIENAEEAALGKTPAQLKKMNVFQKLQLARKIVSEMQIQKSGANDTEGFNYFELADFVPMLNKLGDRIGLMPQFSMTNDTATLKIVNIDKPSEVADFSIPTADLQMQNAEGKAAEGIQILGGKTTYLRRYLYQIAYEISVKDTVDSRSRTPEKPVDQLDPRDIQAIDEASDVMHLNTICQNIKNRKGFTKHQALLKEYTKKKEELEK